MIGTGRSSRAWFEEYRRKRKKADEDDRVIGAEDGPKQGRARSRSFWSLLAAFWRLADAARPIFTFALATRTLGTLIALLPPVLLKALFDSVLGTDPLPAWMPLPHDRVALLWCVAVGLALLPFTATIVGLWGRWKLTKATRIMHAAVRRRVFEHASRLPLHRVQRLKSGGVTALLREDAGTVSDLTFNLFYNPWGAIVQLTGTLIILAVVDWRMLAGGLLVLPIVWVTHRAWIARIRPVQRDIKAVKQTTDAHATEAFAGMRVVRAFSRETGEALRFTRRNHFAARQEILAWWWSRGIEAAWDFLIPVATACVVLYGGYAVLGERLRTGDLVMFVAYVTMLLGPIAMLTTSATSVQTQLAALDRVLDLLAEKPEFADERSERTVDRSSVAGRITVEHVWFAYPRGAGAKGERVEERWVLEDVSLDVPPGSVVALVGPSGAGKTTLCNLIARFYDPQRGRVLLDGIDLRTIEPASYRRLLGIVEQDVFLFDGTVAENIAYARRGTTRGQIVEAARLAHAHEFVERLERGYDTVIGERGVRLSGGQKQRIAIARAVLADPVVLILDEATSNLDAESEALIRESLATLMRGRTTFVIAHRLSTVRDADRIVVIDGGRIVEEGTHDTLLALGGRYAGFLARQLEHAPVSPPVADAGEIGAARADG